MDPQAAWTEMLEAINHRNWDRVQELADGLLDWLRRRGFPPQTTVIEMRRGWDRVIAEFSCRVALQYVQDAKARKPKGS